MKRIRMLRNHTALGAVVLLLGLAPPTLQAEFECKQELAAGAWVANYWYSQFDAPVEPPAIAGVAAGVFDEQGRATEWRFTEMGSDGFFPWGFDITDVLDIQATVNADCTLNITGIDPASGALVIDTHFVCAEGQRECWGIQTHNSSLTLESGEVALAGLITLKWTEPVEQKLKVKIDGLTKKMDAVMRRLGLVPGAFEDDE